MGLDLSEGHAGRLDGRLTSSPRAVGHLPGDPDEVLQLPLTCWVPSSGA
jgi:hypothetical protein